MRSLASLLAPLALVALAAPAHADPPKVPAAAPRVARAPSAPAAMRGASPIALKTTALRAAALSTIAVSARKQPAETRAPEPTAPLEITPQVSDPGVKVRVDDKTGRVVVSGVAHGPAAHDELPFPRYEVARAVTFRIDKDKMPDFSKDPDYSRKNRWFFSHLAETTTSKGDTAITVARRLAESLNKGGAFRATVHEHDEGAAIELVRQ